MEEANSGREGAGEEGLDGFHEKQARQHWDNHHWSQRLDKMIDRQTGESLLRTIALSPKVARFPVPCDHRKSLLISWRPLLSVATGSQHL